MQSLNNNFNLHRLERYLSLSWQSGAIPVIILTKKDLVKNFEIYINQDYLLKDKYSSKIEQYLNQYKNINIIPQDTSIQLEHIEFNNYDILDITKSMIPEELRSKYNQILSRISPSI